MLFNIIFTAFTISYIGVFDQDIRYRHYTKNKNKQTQDTNVEKTEKDSQADSEFQMNQTRVLLTIKDHMEDFYYITRRGIYYGMSYFAIDCLETVLYSGLSLLLNVYIFDSQAIDIDGHMGDFWTVSISIYIVLIIVSNLLCVLRGSHITWLLICTIFTTSLIPFFAFMMIYDRATYLNVNNTYTVRFLFKNRVFYLAVFVNIFCLVLYDLLKWFMKFYFSPTLVEYVLKLKKEGLID